MPSYIVFREDPNPHRKTRKFSVLKVANPEESPLGFIHYFNHWRRYIFAPACSTLYDSECLKEIAEFCEKLTEEQKKEAANGANLHGVPDGN